MEKTEASKQRNNICVFSCPERPDGPKVEEFIRVLVQVIEFPLIRSMINHDLFTIVRNIVP